MKLGKSYWSLTVKSEQVKQQLCTDRSAKNVRSNCEAIRTSMKFQLNNKLDYATEAEADQAHAKLDEVTRRFVMVCETTPVNLGLGWC